MTEPTPTPAPVPVPEADDECDPVLLAAYRELDAMAASPGLQPRALILAAARHQAAFHARRKLWQRPGFLIALAVVAAGAAAAVAVQVMRKPHDAAATTTTTTTPAPMVAAPVVEALPVAEPAAGEERGATGTTAGSAAPALANGDAAAASALVLLPPRESSLAAIVSREAGRRFQSLLDSQDERTWVAGLLFDHNRKLLRVADPVLLPASAGAQGDPRNASNSAYAAHAFGLKESDYDNGVGTMLNAGPQPLAGHPHLMVWAYTLRDDADLQTEAVVRAAVLAHFGQQLPARPANGDVALLTVVMTGDGAIDRFELLYRQPPANGLTDDAFDADRDKRYSRLGLAPDEMGKAGSLKVASEALPAGRPAGLVVVSYVWPKALARARPAAKPDSGIDEVAAVAMLKSVFTPQRLADNSDGLVPWILLDSKGHVLRSGRLPPDELKAPTQARLMDAFPGIRIDRSAHGDYRDAAASGQRVNAQFYWLAADSPLPR